MKNLKIVIVSIVSILILVSLLYFYSGQEEVYFVVYGDTQKHTEKSFEVHEKIVGIIEKRNPDFIVHVGDLVNDASSEKQWQDYLRIQEPIKNISFYSVLGNHEYALDLNATNYKKKINEDDYYSINYENNHLVFLDSNAWSENDIHRNKEEYQREQLKWLNEDLSNLTTENIFVFFHHPMIGAGCHRDYYELRQDLVSLFKKYDIKAVFNGHDHLYERSEFGGINFIITGGGGGNTCHIQGINPYRIYRFEDFHLLEVRIKGKKIFINGLTLNEEIFDKIVLS